MRTVSTRTRITLVAVLVAAIVGATVVDTSSAHRQTTRTNLRWVPVTASGTSSEYHLRVTSRNRACYRRVPIKVVQNGRIVYSARTNARGIAPSLHTGGPRVFGPDFAGSRAIVRTRTLRRSSGHLHRCGGKSRPFPAPTG